MRPTWARRVLDVPAFLADGVRSYIERIPPRVRLALTATAFAGWLGFLAYLVVTQARWPPDPVTGRPVVLSRPQFLSADLDAVAEVRKADEPVTITQVLWSRGEDGQKWVNKTEPISNLAKCAGWEGPGVYLVPLQVVRGLGQERLEVAPVPPSGYVAPLPGPRIYKATPEARRQQEAIRKP